MTTLGGGALHGGLEFAVWSLELLPAVFSTGGTSDQEMKQWAMKVRSDAIFQGFVFAAFFPLRLCVNQRKRFKSSDSGATML